MGFSICLEKLPDNNEYFKTNIKFCISITFITTLRPDFWPEMEFLNGIFSRGFWHISLLRFEFLSGFLPSFFYYTKFDS